MAKKPQAVEAVNSDVISLGNGAGLHYTNFSEKRIAAIESYLVHLSNTMGHIGIPSFKPYSGDENDN
jgi:hypothetical protein